MKWNPFRQRVPTADLALPDARRESRVFVGYALFFIAAAFPTGLLIRRWPIQLGITHSFLNDLWYVVPFKIVLLLIVPVALHHRLGHRLQDLLYGWRPTRGAVTRVVVAFLVGAFINVQWVPDIRAAAAHTPAALVAARVTAGALVALFNAGLPEELMFRGFLQTRLERAYGRLPAICLTTVLFTAWHLPTRYFLASGIEGHAGSWASVAKGTGIPVALAGLVFCLAWDRWRNMPALVAAHWAVDAMWGIADYLGAPPR
jgi:CAAX protease family protein